MTPARCYAKITNAANNKLAVRSLKTKQCRWNKESQTPVPDGRIQGSPKGKGSKSSKKEPRELIHNKFKLVTGDAG